VKKKPAAAPVFLDTAMTCGTDVLWRYDLPRNYTMCFQLLEILQKIWNFLVTRGLHTAIGEQVQTN
jgi:hypothetical protein